MIDAENAIKTLFSSLEQMGYDPRTGQFDSLLTTYGVSTSHLDRKRKIISIIKDCSKESNNGLAYFEDVAAMCDTHNINAVKVESIINELLKNGEVMSPRSNYYKII